MSVEAFRAGMELRSRHLGRAVPAAGRRRVVVHPEAVGVVALAMAGERTGLWGIAFGKVRRSDPKIAAVGDARDYSEQTRLWREMASVFATAGKEPQLIVPSRQTARLLVESAARFRYHEDPGVAQAAEMAWWCLTRREVAGSHSAVVLTESLGEHFAIGADDGTDDDLRVWLAWIGATDQEDLELRVAKRLAEPPDPKTDVDFDEKLWPKVERRDKERAERRQLADEILSKVKRRRLEKDIALQARTRASTVKVALLPTLRAGWSRLRTAAELLGNDPRPALADLEKFCEADQESWAREVSRRERGFGMSRRDSARTAVIGMAEAEAAQGCWEGALVWDDPMARLEALAAGHAVAGTVTESDAAGFTIAASTEGARARVGDAMAFMGPNGPLGLDVVDVSDDGGAVSVSVEWSGGGFPRVAGDEAVLWPPPPDYSRRFLGWLSGRIKEKHWALGDHDGGSPSAQTSTATGPDPLAAVEALRMR